MRSTRTLALTLALCASLTVPATAALAGTSALAEAVTFLPPGTTDMGFTDWARIRASLGAQDVTGVSPIEDKLAVVMATADGEAAASGFGMAHLRGHRDAWGWDTLDLDWEAIYSTGGPPVAIVRLRDGVDTAAIAGRYDAYGFTTERVGDATLRTHKLDPTADWVRTTDLGVTNTAFLDDGRTLLFSSSRDALEGALRDGASALVPGATGVVEALGEPSAAWLVLGPGCPAFTPLPFDPFDPEASIRPLATGEALHPWTALGIGYERPDWPSMGRVAMGFLQAAHAQADLAPRAGRARDGTSQFDGRPYSETLFTLDDSHVDGTTIVLDLSPLGDKPQRLFRMVQTRDMTFAGC